jgi:hypothetical protein
VTRRHLSLLKTKTPEKDPTTALLDHVALMVDFWASKDDYGASPSMTKEEALDGLAFSIFAMLDGCSNAGCWELRPVDYDDEDNASVGESVTGKLHHLWSARRTA